LPELCNTFEIEFEEILINTRKPIIEEVEKDKKSIIELLNTEKLKNIFYLQFNQDFDGLIKKINNLQAISTINGIKEENNILYNKCIEKINKEIEKEQQNKSSEERTNITTGETKQKTKTISLRQIIPSNTEINNKKDLDTFIENLKRTLEKELNQNDKIDVRS